MLKENNLFQFATKELSQDAIICWCLNWIHYPESKLYPMAKDLFKLLGQDDVDFNQKITIKKQVKKIDILVLFHDINKILIIEDKTYTSEHDDQLERYKKIIEEDKSIGFTVDNNTDIQTVYFKTGYFFDDDKRIEIDKKADIIVNGKKFFDVIGKNAYKGVSDILDDYVASLSDRLTENKKFEDFCGLYDDDGRFITWSRISQYKLMREFFPMKKWEMLTDIFKVYSGTNPDGRPWTETNILEKQVFIGTRGDFYIFWRIDTDNNGPYLSLRFYEKFDKKDEEKVKRHNKTYRDLINLAKSIVESEEFCFKWNNIEDGFRGNYYESSLLRIGLSEYLKQWKEKSNSLINSVSRFTDCFIEKFNNNDDTGQAKKTDRIEKMQQVFNEIEKHISNRLVYFGVQKSYIDLSKEYYESNKNVCPSLNYLLATCGDYNIVLRFEVQDKLYFGVVFFKNEWDKEPKESSKIIDAFSSDLWKKLIKSHKGKDWWLWKDLLPAKDKLINFRQGSGCYPDLYDQEGHSKIMQEIYLAIDTHLEAIKNTGVRR